MSATPKWTDVANNTNPIWYKDASLRRNVALGLGLYQLGLLSGFQAMPSWQKYFNNPKGALLGIYAASFFIPSIFTAFVGDMISTKLGRRWCILIANAILLVGALVNTFAVSVGMWCGGRAIMGTGVGIVKVATPVLIQEIAHPRLRPILGSCYQTFAYMGIAFAAFMTFAGLYVPGDWGWRFPSILQVVGPIAVITVVLNCPESPRWLIKNGRAEEAHNILAALHANGDRDDPLVLLEVKEITQAIERESHMQKASFLDFLRTPGNRRRLVALIAMACSLNWMGNGIITYFLSPILKSIGITAPIQITLINAGLAIWNLILAGITAVFCDKVGRRPLFLMSIVGMLCSYIVVMGLSAGFANTKNHSMGVAVIPFLFIYFGFYDMAFTPLPVAYTVEILPFSIRSTGMALFTSFATLGNSFNQFVNPIALGAIGWKYYAVYVAILFFYLGLVYFMFPETKRLSAEDASRVFDYDRKGRLLGKVNDDHPENGVNQPEDEGKCAVSAIENREKP
ncbi:hexose transporter protein [Aspergillus homomorphus CBS 101889]|uniref:Hexose transporter protein n=1 Tax=Aspergillus homomorphus (strain CBS 101889) TaxID=1450537 RepID=A0A395HR81_ASPHC|nr:hexose transporter protein [Aspergillus homomorphus CBS 101889]RAL08764.1 hexose transporter protein [Aspergillus homomorphus CBS 101889]